MINVVVAQEAKKKTDSGPWGYLVGGAENELALRRNRQAFQRWSFLPQGLYDVSQIDLSTNFLNFSLRMPVLSAPIGGLTQFHERGDLEWSLGLSMSEILGTVSGVARIEMNKIIKENDYGLFYQLYFFGDDRWVKDQLQLAESCGYKAIVVTMDTKYFGQRERDILIDYDARNAGWRSAPQPPDRMRNVKLDLRELEKIKSYTKLPFIVKGVLSQIEVQQLAKIGIDAIWISNHGGRQLDAVSASLDSLVRLAPECEKKGISIIFDGGVRRGSEVLLAYLLGADMVAVGRLPIYGLIIDGAKGIKNVFSNLEDELRIAMGLVGITNFKFDRREMRDRIIEENIFGLNTVWDEIEK